MSFDWTITFGNIVMVAAFTLTAVGVFYGMRGDIILLTQRIGSVEGDLSNIDSTLKQIVKIFIELARQEERLSAMDRRLNDQNGRLMILERSGNGRTQD